jgi:hypothetical protein
VSGLERSEVKLFGVESPGWSGPGTVFDVGQPTVSDWAEISISNPGTHVITINYLHRAISITFFLAYQIMVSLASLILGLNDNGLSVEQILSQSIIFNETRSPSFTYIII